MTTHNILKTVDRQEIKLMIPNISQIEVVKGAASVLSGSSALSGSVNIRTAYPGAKPKTKINLYSGFYSKPDQEGATWWNKYPGIFGANFLHSQMFGNLDLVVGGNINFDHGYIGPPITDDTVATVFPDTISNFSESDLISKRGRVNFNLRYRSKKTNHQSHWMKRLLMAPSFFIYSFSYLMKFFCES